MTGIGAVSSAGPSVAALRASLVEERRAIGPNSTFELGFEVATGQAPAEAFAQHDFPSLDSRTGRLCLCAARQCVDMATAGGASVPDGLIVGTSTGGQSENERAVFSLLRCEHPGAFSYRGQGCMASPTRLVHRALRIEGPVTTVSTACTSSALAIAMGALWLRQGRANRVLCGGGDGLCCTTLSGFRKLDLTGPLPCTPFGEPLAQLCGLGMSSDANHMTAPLEDGSGAEAAMRAALADAGLAPRDICHVNAHGTGTKLNDAAEAAAIFRLLGHDVPVMSVKGVVGHTLGGAGAIEAVACVLSIRERRAYANVGAGHAGPDCPVSLVPSGGLPLPQAPCILSNSFAFGGNNCALIFAACEAGERP
ncbi:MAG: beta-ketoacyl-ACP synthase [Myxococcota bacterium]|nr:beta-ketoacyl-ACP synthase [Myxococcota bacterium]